jgi:hypothetical protein
VLTLGAVILRTSKDHEVAIRVGEAAPVLGRCSLIFGGLLIAVPDLVLAGLTQHALEKLAVLELVLDRVVVIGARLFQELLEVVGVALSLARAVRHRDYIGVGMRSVLLLSFPCPKEGLSSLSSHLPLPLDRPLVKTTSTTSSPKAWFMVISRSSRVVCGFGQPSLE